MDSTDLLLGDIGERIQAAQGAVVEARLAANLPYLAAAGRADEIASRLADAALALYGDPARREAMLGRQAATPMRNGLDSAVDSLAELVRAPSRERDAHVASRP